MADNHVDAPCVADRDLDLDLKSFMDLHDIPMWATEQDRLRDLLERRGYVVWRIERTHRDTRWSVWLTCPGVGREDTEGIRRSLRLFFRGHGIRLDREEPVIAWHGKVFSAHFLYAAGVRGLGLRFAGVRNKVFRTDLREVYTLPKWN